MYVAEKRRDNLGGQKQQTNRQTDRQTANQTTEQTADIKQHSEARIHKPW